MADGASGTTGQPKGVIRDNGGHMVAAKTSEQQDFVQPVQHLAPLPGVLHRIEKVENRS